MATDIKNNLTRRQKANAIRALAMDSVEHANSGHPGAPMGMADIAEVLWSDFLKYNPKNPNWFNRDRFILSNGHASMLLYSVLHLSGYDLKIDDLKNFRQLHSKTPGHPENYLTPGVETTTGPLGQGFANAVGFGIAEKLLAAKFNKDQFAIVDHFTYVFLGDGCLMEGISHEAASLAGALGIGKLIAIWDDNNISIDGVVTPWFNDNTAQRFAAYGWQVIENVDGHDAASIKTAIEQARKNTNQPSLICCKTIIGYGAPNKQNTEDTHGAPLGSNEIKAAREQLGWVSDPFVIPDEYYQAWDYTKQGQDLENTWQELFNQYNNQHPELAQEFLRRMQNQLPADWDKFVTDYVCSLQAGQKDVATRKASQNVLSAFAPNLPEFLGGSADLTGSNGTLWQNAKVINGGKDIKNYKIDWNGQYLHFGVREFAMAAIGNGLSLHGGFIPFGGTFLTFLDYGRNALRMAALMQQRNIFVYTHDSIALGEDGPTHQPIEHLTMLRATPNVECWRPCDSVETAVAWQQAITNQTKPTVLALTRQTTKAQNRDLETVKLIAKGGYILSDFDGGDNQSTLSLILIATGSEVELATEAKKEINYRFKNKYNIRVVSMPCMEKFRSQSVDYKNFVLSHNVNNRLVIETGSAMCWHEFVASSKQIIGIDRFGESAPAEDLLKYFGFTVENIVNKALDIIGAA